jgi:hypothetical protein
MDFDPTPNQQELIERAAALGIHDDMLLARHAG